MFSGIIEEVGEIIEVEKDGTNKRLRIASQLAGELKIDQSISHDGICLTVTELHEKSYSVVAVKETLELTSLNQKSVGEHVNLERCVKVGERLDGHIVQGHVDAVGTCANIKDEGGSWIFTFDYPKKDRKLLVSKGSVTVNGVSLTVVNPTNDQFSIAVIPYTYAHTTFQYLNIGTVVNLEYDIIGKYLDRRLSTQGL